MRSHKHLTAFGDGWAWWLGLQRHAVATTELEFYRHARVCVGHRRVAGSPAKLPERNLEQEDATPKRSAGDIFAFSVVVLGLKVLSGLDKAEGNSATLAPGAVR